MNTRPNPRRVLSRNSAGLVEIYLGDIGRDIPSPEWPHLLAHNIVPVGKMAEDRFHRDFLGQFASSVDPLNDLKETRRRINAQFEKQHGKQLWKPMEPVDEAEFEKLLPPTSSSRSALKLPVLTLTKAMVDAIDAKLLGQLLNRDKSDDGALLLMEEFVQTIGGTRDVIAPLRDLQRLRSKSGIAHLASRSADRLLEAWGTQEWDAKVIFDRIIDRLIFALSDLEALCLSAQEL